MPRVVHFEIPSGQPERAARFYSDVFGWQANKWDGPQDYWLLRTGKQGEPGIDGGLLRKKAPDQPVVNTVDVPNVDDYAARVTRAGGTIVVPKMPIPGVGWLVYFKDLDGNIVGMMQTDEKAGVE